MVVKVQGPGGGSFAEPPHQAWEPSSAQQLLTSYLGSSPSDCDALADIGRLTVFHGMRSPPISVEAYILRLAKYTKCSPACFAYSFLYMSRLAAQDTALVPTLLNVHRLVLTSVLLAAKFLDDRYYNNAYYARVGGITTEEMNRLEMEMLKCLNFSLGATPEAVQALLASLSSGSFILELWGSSGRSGCDVMNVGGSVMGGSGIMSGIGNSHSNVASALPAASHLPADGGFVHSHLATFPAFPYPHHACMAAMPQPTPPVCGSVSAAAAAMAQANAAASLTHIAAAHELGHPHSAVCVVPMVGEVATGGCCMVADGGAGVGAGAGMAGCGGELVGGDEREKQQWQAYGRKRRTAGSEVFDEGHSEVRRLQRCYEDGSLAVVG